jgi:tetratricopeptide (TPR) repeat protein
MTSRPRAKTTHAITVCLRTTSLLICTLLWGCAERADTPEVLVERGHLLEGRGQFTDAIDAYTNALAQRPNDATIYYDRGVAYGRLNRWSEATDDYTQAIEHNGATARVYNNRAAAFAQQHQYKRAVEDFTQAIHLDKGAALSYRNRGLAYHDSGQLKQAIDDFTVAIQLEPNAFDGPFERGNAYLDAHEFQKAIDDFTQAIELNHTNAAVWVYRAEAYSQLGNAKQAKADTDKAKQLDPNIHIAALEQAPPPVIVSNNPAPPQAVSSAELSRREQALRVARTYLESKGFHVESSPAPAPFDLACAKGAKRLRVEVQAPAVGQSKLQLTREQVEAIRKGDQPTALVVVGELENPTAPGRPATGGKVVDFQEDWKPDQRKLVPLLYEYPRQ